MSWDEHFRDAHLHSWPHPMVTMAGDIFARDEKEILSAAETHGYRKFPGPRNHIQFFKNARA